MFKMKTFDKIVNKLNGIALLISSIGVFLLMFIIVIGVGSRSLFGYSVPAAYEITENYLMPLTIFPALAYSYSNGIFPRVGVFVNRFQSLKVKQVINCFIIGLELLIYVLMAYIIFQFSIHAYQDGISFNAIGHNFPLYHFYFLTSFSFGLLSLPILSKFIKGVKDKGFDPYL